jgi:two-component system invasion response regulator UvrY
MRNRRSKQTILMLRILIADDHPIVRSGLKELIKAGLGANVQAEARDEQELLTRLSERRFDLVIIDLGLSQKDGLEVIENMNKRYPKLAILVYTVYSEEEYGLRALHAGAAGYLCKSSPAADLITAINRVVSGTKFMSPNLAAMWASRSRSEKLLNPDLLLSNREHEVVRKIATGRAIKEIAAELEVSPKTISTYRARALQKLGLKNNADLARHVITSNC